MLEVPFHYRKPEEKCKKLWCPFYPDSVNILPHCLHLLFLSLATDTVSFFSSELFESVDMILFSVYFLRKRTFTHKTTVQ